jgi:hypothetical protein
LPVVASSQASGTRLPEGGSGISWTRSSIFTTSRGVKRACRNEPDKNPDYAKLARDYQVGGRTAGQIKRSQGQGQVRERGAAGREGVLAPLRNRTFFSLRELQEVAASLTEALNDRKLSEVP